jgi:hypothetical protein
LPFFIKRKHFLPKILDIIFLSPHNLKSHHKYRKYHDYFVFHNSRPFTAVRLLMFERKYEKLAPVSVFVRRMAKSVAMAGLLVAGALFLGVSGYHWIA